VRCGPEQVPDRPAEVSHYTARLSVAKLIRRWIVPRLARKHGAVTTSFARFIAQNSRARTCPRLGNAPV